MKINEDRRYLLGRIANERRKEQQGRRPAIIVQDENYGGRLPTVFVIPLSSSRNALRFAGTALIAANLTSGLRNDSTALVFQCRAIDRKRIGERIGSVTIDERQEVFAEWRKLTGQKS